MFSKKMMVLTALVFAGRMTIASAQNDVVSRGNGTSVWGQTRENFAGHLSRTHPPATANIKDAGLVTIFSNLAATYPKGEYWCWLKGYLT